MSWDPELSPSAIKLLIYVALTLATIYFVSGLDDAFIDLVAYLKSLKPKALSQANQISLNNLAEKKFAIMIPAWREGNIITKMLFGNLSRLNYSNFHIFIGVYPNDPETIQAVRKVTRRYSHIHAITNDKQGPTSKGQMLNYTVASIFQYEVQQQMYFDAFLMQDAEDLFHPLILKLMNSEINQYAFVQTPVFSLEVRPNQLVAGTYIDEFAELHTKDILVREALGAAVPSAGVGTVLSRKLVLRLREEYGMRIYNEASLTEDYELGQRAHNLGFRPHFSCYFYEKSSKGKEFIATREYFPKTFSRSVRQKTRWTIGISLQGWRHLGWTGSGFNRYFLYRDRKGLLTNVAVLLGYPVIVAMALIPQDILTQPFESQIANRFIYGMFFMNLLFFALRIYQRVSAVDRVYGLRGILTIPLRWPVAITVNAFAVLTAIRTDMLASITRKKIAWVKTEHELPLEFETPVSRVENV